MFFFVALFCACDKEEENGDPFEPLVYHSLMAERTTLTAGETTKIKASASGSNLVYTWSSTLGDLLGSGSEVIYAPSICQVGTNKVTCTVSNNKNQSESKTIEITVVL